MERDSRPLKFFVFAGELSADLHGSMLVRELKNHLPHSHFHGVAGPAMRVQGVSGPYQMEDFEVMGFSDVLKCLSRLWRQFNHIRDEIISLKPDATIFIDSPSFSLRMAKALRKAGYSGKIVQYICPTVWAWGKERIPQMAKTFDLLLPIYPFEAAYFSDTSLKVEYVGNPLLEAIRNYKYDAEWGLKRQPLIALFPGSRKGEIARNLPKQVQAAQMISQKHPEVSFGISCAHEKNTKEIEAVLQRYSLQNAFLVPKGHTYDLMRNSRAAIAKSGTVTLELALHQCPTVVMYELTWLNYLIAKYVLKVNLPYYCIVNILMNRMVFPEFIANQGEPRTIVDKLERLYVDGDVRKVCLSECSEIEKLLGKGEASKRAAKAIVEGMQG